MGVRQYSRFKKRLRMWLLAFPPRRGGGAHAPRVPRLTPRQPRLCAPSRVDATGDGALAFGWRGARRHMRGACAPREKLSNRPLTG